MNRIWMVFHDRYRIVEYFYCHCINPEEILKDQNYLYIRCK